MRNEYHYGYNPYELMAHHYDELFVKSPFYNNTNIKEEELFANYVRYVCNGEEALDIGCGTGDYSIELSKQGYITTGIDISSKMLEIARKKAGEENARVIFNEMDARDLTQLNNSYDLALAYGSFINHLDDIESFIFDLGLIIKKGGRFLFSYDNIMGIDFFLLLLRDLLKRKNKAQTISSLKNTLHCVLKNIRQKNHWDIHTAQDKYSIELSYWPTNYILNNLKKNNFEIEDVQSTNTISCFIPKILMSSINPDAIKEASEIVNIICGIDRKMARFLNRIGANIIVVCRRM